ncbi:Mce family protein Mce3C [Mycobacterium saskatchewanense]|uniref:Mammalian cell entry protein n=1 Tax=Mycobacterium saskatchewanense TaxID=220927 RepID=A0AAJ3TTI0_9MYCO|nr:MCE family protein [Mycobacterium saskatchewanense]ORW68112.1 mammalian cell entry protein [Mycobacterium saskatchewanense]BBX66432.1 Mce family protein Mce3C [Mycobacterium saskatchewanense]
MKWSLQQHNPLVIGGIGLGVVAAVIAFALNFHSIGFLNHTTGYTAYFAEASGLAAGTDVQVAGLKVGKVTAVALETNKVKVEFEVSDDVRLGDRSEAAVKTKALLGTKVLEVTTRGDGPLSAPIPLDRTQPAYQLTDALGDLSTAISGLHTDDLNQSLATLAQTFADTPAGFKIAVDGVARISHTLSERDAQLRSLLANANKATTVLADRSRQIVDLVRDTNALLAALREQRHSMDQISSNISKLSQQLSGFIDDNRSQLRPALDKLNGVLAIIDNRKEQIQKSIKLLNSYAMSLGESVASGPFFKAYLANLVPGQFIQPFVDAAFSDLGLDPNVLSPSQRVDPPTGQPGTPPLPVPYPRTGQGGEPNRTLPDAITGNPGDPRYPYREPLPAPPTGGPPPGPPAVGSPGPTSGPAPTPTSFDVPPPPAAHPPPSMTRQERQDGP